MEARRQDQIPHQVAEGIHCLTEWNRQGSGLRQGVRPCLLPPPSVAFRHGSAAAHRIPRRPLSRHLPRCRKTGSALASKHESWGSHESSGLFCNIINDRLMHKARRERRDYRSQMKVSYT